MTIKQKLALIKEIDRRNAESIRKHMGRAA